MNIEIVSFLCADYKRGNAETGDAVHFLFLGKIAEDAEIKIDEKEIKQFIWTSPTSAIAKFDEHLGARVKCALQAIEKGLSYYCEEGNIIF